jgi:hypothetical protein
VQHSGAAAAGPRPMGLNAPTSAPDSLAAAIAHEDALKEQLRQARLYRRKLKADCISALASSPAPSASPGPLSAALASAPSAALACAASAASPASPGTGAPFSAVDCPLAVGVAVRLAHAAQQQQAVPHAHAPACLPASPDLSGPLEGANQLAGAVPQPAEGNGARSGDSPWAAHNRAAGRKRGGLARQAGSPLLISLPHRVQVPCIAVFLQNLPKATAHRWTPQKTPQQPSRAAPQAR